MDNPIIPFGYVRRNSSIPTVEELAISACSPQSSLTNPEAINCGRRIGPLPTMDRQELNFAE